MGRKIIDLIGKIFGKLLVIERSENKVFPNGYSCAYWLCRCECGNEVIVQSKHLKSGTTKSCGCSKNFLYEDLTGLVFGRLTVLGLSPKENKSDPKKWLCKCSCGKETSVLTSSLNNGKTTSCGCYNSEVTSELNTINLVGKIFGFLKVIEIGYKKKFPKKTVIYWKCECRCSSICFVTTGKLSSGHTKSCGCLSESFISSEVKRYLKQKYKAITEYKIFKNPDTGYWLPYDIYIPYGNNPELNGFYVEVHGEQHYKLNPWHKLMSKKNGTTPEEEFEYQKHKDKIKKKFAKKNGYYIEVNLLKIKIVEEAIEYIQTKIKEI